MTDTNFIDAESDVKSENTSFREIVMRHVERISKLSAMEYFHGGFYEQIPAGNTFIDRWVPDGKDVYSNAVQNLCDLLFAYFDKEMIADEESFHNSIKKAQETYHKCAKNEDATGKDCSLYFKQSRYKAYTQLFRSICVFLRRKKFLEVGVMEE